MPVPAKRGGLVIGESEAQSLFIYAVCGGGKPGPKAGRGVNKVIAELRAGVSAEWTDAHPFSLLNLHHEKEVAVLLAEAGFKPSLDKSKAICQAAGLWVADILDLSKTDEAQLLRIPFVSAPMAALYLHNANSKVA